MSDLIATAARFSGRVRDYARYRPSYPPEAIDAILDGLGDVSALTVVDVGAGTGISSRLFAERGANVIAIEPNPEMREVAHAQNLDARDGTAEASGLPDACADVVAAFQAFHWFAHERAVAEFVRLLRPGGRVALVWNVRDTGHACTREYGQIADLDSSAAQRAGQVSDDEDLGSLLQGAGLRNVRTLDFQNAQRLTLDALLGRARSASYVPQDGPEYDAIAAALTDLHQRSSDAESCVSLVYRTAVHLAERP